MRSVYLVSYDISDDKRRNRIFRIMLDNGDHVQYSVFICQLSLKELVTLRAMLQENIKNNEDQIIILKLGAHIGALESSLDCLGRTYKPACRVQVV